MIKSSPVIAWVTRQIAYSPPISPPRPVRGFGLAVFLAIFILLSGFGDALLNDPDSYWHIHVGRVIWNEGRFPVADQWSYTVTGSPWIAKEWLSQIILAAADALGGPTAVAMVAAAAIAGAFGLLAAAAASRMGTLPALILVAIVFALTAGHMLARPHAFAFLPMVATGLLLTRAAEEARAPSPWLIPVVALWANLHGSFLLVFGLLAALMVEAVVRAEPDRRRRVALGWLGIGALCALAPLVHPYGPGVYSAAFGVLGIEGIDKGIFEWKAEDFGTLSAMQVVVFGGFAALALHPVRLPLIRTALLVVFAYMALTHIRHAAVFGFLGAVMLITPIGALLDRPQPASEGRGWPKIAAGLAAIALALGIVNATIRPLAPPANIQPVAALAAARAAGVKGQVFNAYGFGGYLIAQGVPTFIDGRTELYGGKRLARYLAAADVDSLEALDAILKDRRIGWTLLPPGLRAVDVLDRTPGWRRIYADDIAVVHVREPAAGREQPPG
ncbi:MAG: hypothetical protein GC147_08935 [Porphyrobacter sp.]|nr:hypothetical protein [Porphyrobacter sp.]